MESREAQDVIHVIQQSFKDRESLNNFAYMRPRMVHNPTLLQQVGCLWIIYSCSLLNCLFFQI